MDRHEETWNRIAIANIDSVLYRISENNPFIPPESLRFFARHEYTVRAKVNAFFLVRINDLLTRSFARPTLLP